MKRVILLVALVAGLLAVPTVGLASDQPGEPGGEKVFSTGGTFTVEILPRSAFFTNIIYLDQPGPTLIASAAATGPVVGTFGPFVAGDELIFRIDVVNTGLSYFTGPGSRNLSDELEHAIVTTNGPGDLTVAFEDLDGLGDHDFFDARFRLTGAIVGPCDPEVEGDCSEEDENGSGAGVVCVDGNCLPVVLSPLPLNGDNAAFNVDTLENDKGEVFEMVITMATRELSTPPGIAEVEMFPDSGGSLIMERCTQTDDENCIVSITRIRGGLTEYTLRFKADPRFRFR